MPYGPQRHSLSWPRQSHRPSYDCCYGFQHAALGYNCNLNTTLGLYPKPTKANKIFNQTTNCKAAERPTTLLTAKNRKPPSFAIGPLVGRARVGGSPKLSNEFKETQRSNPNDRQTQLPSAHRPWRQSLLQKRVKSLGRALRTLWLTFHHLQRQGLQRRPSRNPKKFSISVTEACRPTDTTTFIPAKAPTPLYSSNPADLSTEAVMWVSLRYSYYRSCKSYPQAMLICLVDSNFSLHNCSNQSSCCQIVPAFM